MAREESGFTGVIGELLRLVGRSAVHPARIATEMVFDRRMGVRTRGILFNEADVAALSMGRDPVRCQPIDPSSWKQMLRTIPIEPGTATFVDMGAGRGRALVLAAEAGFRRVVGVELDPRIATEAEENIRHWRSRRREPEDQPDVVMVRGDAATFEPPDGPLVIWLYNPFGAKTLRSVLRQTCARSGGAAQEAFVAYYNPVHESVFGEFPGFVVQSRAKRWAVYRLAR